MSSFYPGHFLLKISLQRATSPKFNQNIYKVKCRPDNCSEAYRKWATVDEMFFFLRKPMYTYSDKYSSQSNSDALLMNQNLITGYEMFLFLRQTKEHSFPPSWNFLELKLFTNYLQLENLNLKRNWVIRGWATKVSVIGVWIDHYLKYWLDQFLLNVSKVYANMSRVYCRNKLNKINQIQKVFILLNKAKVIKIESKFGQ